MNKDNNKRALQRTLIALAVVAMVLIFAAAVANGRRRAAMQVPTPPVSGPELADVLAEQAGTVADASNPSSDASGEATSTAGAPAQPAAIESGEARARPLTAVINVRSGPGTSFGIVGVLKREETAAVLARTQAADWYLVRRDDGLTGWMAANVVEFVLGERGAIGVAVTVPALPALPPVAPPVVATAAPVDDESPTDEPAPPVTHPPVTQVPATPPASTPTAESPVMKTPTPNPYP